MKQGRFKQAFTYTFACMLKCLLPKRWRITCNNIKTVFPDQNTASLAWQTYMHFVGMLLSLPRLDHQLKNTQFLIDDEVLWSQCRQEERLIIMSAHVGFWEILPRFIGANFKQSAHVFYRPAKRMNAQLLRWRQGLNLFFWDNQRQVKSAVQGFKQDGLMGVMADQGSGYQGHFFGLPMRFPVGPEKLVKRFQVPVYFLAAMNEGDHVRIYVKRLDAEAPQASFITQLEQLIKRYPEQYYWLTRLWKT